MAYAMINDLDKMTDHQRAVILILQLQCDIVIVARAKHFADGDQGAACTRVCLRFDGGLYDFDLWDDDTLVHHRHGPKGYGVEIPIEATPESVRAVVEHLVVGEKAKVDAKVLAEARRLKAEATRFDKQARQIEECIAALAVEFNVSEEFVSKIQEQLGYTRIKTVEASLRTMLEAYKRNGTI